MKSGLSRFAWDRFLGGYQWDRQCLVPSDPEMGTKASAPLVDTPELFREFADLPQTKAAFAKFAGSYGLLLYRASSGPRLGASQAPDAYDFDFWRVAQDQLKTTLALVDAARRRRLTKSVVTRLDEGLRAGLGVDGLALGLRGGLSERDHELLTLVQSAWSMLNGHLRESRTGGCAAQVIFRPERFDKTRASLIGPRSQEPMFSLHIVPTSLLSAMFLQVARELTERVEFRRCQHCQQWFEISLETGNRVSKLFCNDKCRIAKWKAEKAIRLAQPKRLSKRTPRRKTNTRGER